MDFLQLFRNFKKERQAKLKILQIPACNLEYELLRVEKRTPENDSNFKDSESIYFLVDWVTTSSGLKFKQQTEQFKCIFLWVNWG